MKHTLTRSSVALILSITTPGLGLPDSPLQVRGGSGKVSAAAAHATHAARFQATLPDQPTQELFCGLWRVSGGLALT
jgi:hypothetical protein